MRTLTGGAIGGHSRVLNRWWMALIILVEGRWTDGLDCEMKGLDSMMGATVKTLNLTVNIRFNLKLISNT